MVDLPIYNKDSEVRFMDNERHVCCPVEFNKALIGKEFMYFDVEGEPFAKQRPRATRKGRFITVYTPRETKLYEAKVLRAYQKIYKNKQLIFEKQ